jgi:hypothetical protein
LDANITMRWPLVRPSGLGAPVNAQLRRPKLAVSTSNSLLVPRIAKLVPRLAAGIVIGEPAVVATVKVWPFCSTRV